MAKKEKHKKISRAKQTLVFEIVDVFVKIIDSSKDEFFLQDTSTKQIYSPTENEIQIMFVKYWEQPLLN